jgi:hypothetical protein
MALVPFRCFASRPSRQRKDKQLVLAEWEECGPGQWRRRTNEWSTPTENEEGRDDC